MFLTDCVVQLIVVYVIFPYSDVCPNMCPKNEVLCHYKNAICAFFPFKCCNLLRNSVLIGAHVLCLSTAVT